MRTRPERRRPVSAHMLTAYEAAEDVGGVNARRIIVWIKEGLIKGAFQLPGKSGWRIPRKCWEQFKRSRTPKAARLSANEEDPTHE